MIHWRQVFAKPLAFILIISPVLLIVPERAEAAALTLYETSTAAATLTTAHTLTDVAPASEATTFTTKIGKSTGWDTFSSDSSTANWAAGASEPAPLGHGWLWDVTTLEGQQIIAGTWTPKIKLKTSVGSINADIHVRVSIYNAGVYTTIIDAVATGQTVSTTATVFTLPATAGALTNVNAGDKLYVDVPVKINTNSSGSNTATVTVYQNGGANESLATPGYQPQPPTVTTSAATGIAQTAATLNGNITAEGANATVRGFAWGTISSLSGGDTATTTESGSFAAGAFTGALSTLVCNTPYYVRAYATNPTGTGLGSIQTFTSSPCGSAPTVTTNFAGGVNFNSANLVGAITNNGGADATQTGFAYGTDAALTTGVSTTTRGAFTGTGTFSGTIGGLSANTTYYFRAYATNTSGTGYGSIQSFGTGNSTPARKMRLFEGFRIKITNGKIMLLQQ